MAKAAGLSCRSTSRQIRDVRMSEIVLCDRIFNEHTLRTQCGLNINNLLDNQCKPPKRVDPHTPYLLNGKGDRNDRHIQTMLARPQARKIVELSNVYGADNVVAMSELFGNLRGALASDPSTVGMGAAASVYGERMNGFVKSVGDYQNSLIDYHNAVKAKSPTIETAKQNVLITNQKMNAGFGVELGQIKNRGGRRGTPLTSVERGIRIARDSRNVTRLDLVSPAQTSKLVHFTQYTKLLGNGLAVVDFGSRVGNIKLESDRGGDPYRQLFIESSSFVASAGSGYVVGTVGGAAVTFLVMLTPVGWAGLVLVAGSAAVVGASAYASMNANDYEKKNAGDRYDRIIAWISR
jgi:hypothetical protein